MPEREWRFRLEDMLSSAEKILRYTAGMSKADFVANTLVIDAVVRNLEIIGVASRHVPDGARAQMTEVAWSQIWGMRNRLVHDYLDVDLDILWETIDLRIAELASQLRNILTDDR